MTASPDASRLDHDIGMVMRVVEHRTMAFLRDEMSLEPVEIAHHRHDEKYVELRTITAIVAVGSGAGLYIAFSYDLPLIRAMTKLYTVGLSVPADQEELYIHETASDVVNVIVGNCTADLAKRGELISLSPPVLMVGARTIQSRDGSTVAALTARFEKGLLDIAFVGPKILFDDHLNYRGEGR
jgi:CheY-specific phosphatase CheX